MCQGVVPRMGDQLGLKTLDADLVFFQKTIGREREAVELQEK